MNENNTDKIKLPYGMVAQLANHFQLTTEAIRQKIKKHDPDTLSVAATFLEEASRARERALKRIRKNQII